MTTDTRSAADRHAPSTDALDGDVDSDAAESNWAPARLSTALVLLGTLGLTAVLVAETGLDTPVFVGGVGAVALAATLWLADRDRWRLPATLGASLLLLPVGAGLAIGVGYTLLKQLAGSYAVGSVFVVIGLVVAVFGAAAAVRDVLTVAALRRMATVAVTTLAVPLAWFAVLAALALTPAGDLLDEGVSLAETVLFAPTPVGQPHLTTFWLLVLGVALSTRTVLRALPLVELVDDDTTASVESTLATLDTFLSRLVRWGAPLVFVFLVVDYLAPDAVLGRLPAAVAALLLVVSNATVLRELLFALLVVSGLLGAALWGLKRLYRVSTHGTAVAFTPLVGGSLVTLVAFIDPQAILDTLLTTVTDLLPTAMGEEFSYLSGTVVEFYGPETVVLGLVTGTLFAATLVVGGLLLGAWLGLLSGRAAGASTASSGLLVAVALSKTVGVGAPVVLAGLVVSLLVWDAGDYAVTMGREVGRRGSTSQTELVHFGGSLLVGVVAAGTAAVLAGPIRRGVVDTNVPLLVALAGAAVGAVCFVVALRVAD
ncbi:hypothetical protein SAMN04487950_0262 [Halogranum rubrum]|uniref:Uncharacterized protein n=1 Tax=Halogranum rubrum TaxID=553466 RepID=A0A1I4B233_9EURY|nr:hypothetical protein [Halogranum rubrum]SFK62962.1 hypothetical protein SAMN04487950_0262 [Halogranum rubrum]